MDRIELVCVSIGALIVLYRIITADHSISEKEENDIVVDQEIKRAERRKEIDKQLNKSFNRDLMQ